MPVKKSAARRSETVECTADAIPPPSATASRTSGAESDQIGRGAILKKYWQLANLDPEVTKGTITGQLKALDSLCEELGLAPAAGGSARAAAQETANQGIYRSAWMRTAGTRSEIDRAGKTRDGE